MKKIVYLLFFYFELQVGFCQITFNNTYNNEIDNFFNVVEVDNGYLVAQHAGFPIYPSNVIIKKIDLSGNLLWERVYGDSSEYRITYSLIKTYDSNYVAGAFNYNFVENKLYAYLLKINVNGDSIWSKNYSAPLGYAYYSSYVIETLDHGFLITGQIADTTAPNPVDGDVFILKTDSLGNELWQSVFGGSKFDNGSSSIELPDKGFLTLGWTRSFGFSGSTNRDYYLVKSDSLGNFIWQKTYGTPLNDSPVGITATRDGNYLIAGGQVTVSGVDAQGNIIKIDSSGAIIWQKFYGGPISDDLWWARELSNGDLAAVGRSKDPSIQLDQGWVLRTDSLGSLKWDRSFIIGNSHSYFRDFKETSDGGFVCAGFVFEGPDGTQDAWLVKLDSLGCDSVGCANYTTGIEENNFIVKSNSSLHLFPNPAKDLLTLDFTRNPFTFVKISVFNTLGQRVLLLKQPVRDFATIDVSKLNAGIYTVMAEYEGLRETGEFVKQ